MEERHVVAKTSWQWFALGSAFFAALTAILGKVGVAEINSNLATLIRTLVIVVVSAAIVTGRGEWERLSKLTKSGVFMLCASGVATGLAWLCYYRALQAGPASRVAPVDKLSVVFVMVLALVFLGEPLTRRVFVGGSLVALGAVTLATT
jgi:transporter family protein